MRSTSGLPRGKGTLVSKKREVKVHLKGGELDVDDSASNQQDSNPATTTPLLCWLSTKHNLIDLAEKVFSANESKDTSKKI